MSRVVREAQRVLRENGEPRRRVDWDWVILTVVAAIVLASVVVGALVGHGVV